MNEERMEKLQRLLEGNAACELLRFGNKESTWWLVAIRGVGYISPDAALNILEGTDA